MPWVEQYSSGVNWALKPGGRSGNLGRCSDHAEPGSEGESEHRDDGAKLLAIVRDGDVQKERNKGNATDSSLASKAPANHRTASQWRPASQVRSERMTNSVESKVPRAKM